MNNKAAILMVAACGMLRSTDLFFQKPGSRGSSFARSDFLGTPDQLDCINADRL
jgi:hypothetical protein